MGLGCRERYGHNIQSRKTVKKITTYLFLSLLLAISSVQEASAVRAWPYPVVVTQPDGSQITIQMHGDEYFSWISSDGKLVELGEDGFYRESSLNRVKMLKGMEKRALSLKPNRRAAAAPGNGAVGNTISHGEKRFLVLLIEFKDLSFTVENPVGTFTNLLNQKGYSLNGATGSAKDYFIDQSGAQFTPQFDVVGPVKVGRNMSEYSEEKGMTQDKGAPRLLQEACSMLLEEGFDFSVYDNDSNDEIDNIFFFYAGHNQAEGAAGTIWPHKWQVNSYPTLGGIHLWKYACTSEYRKSSGRELCTIGTFCHEFAHVLGLPDFYDVNGKDDGNTNNEPGVYSIMSAGNYNNNGNTPPNMGIEERALLGWLSGTEGMNLSTALLNAWTKIPELPQKSGVYNLEPVWKNAGYMSRTANNNEYYLYEYRDGSSWDKPLGKGVLIYHVDKSQNMAGGHSARARWANQGSSGCINDVSAHPCYRLVSADGTSSTGTASLFGNSVRKFTDKTKPAAMDWAGNATYFNLSGITHDGSTATLLLNYNAPGAEFRVNAIDIGENKWNSGDVFEFEVFPSDREIEQMDWYYDSVQTAEQSVTLSSGKHTIEVRISYADGSNAWYIAEINVR